VDEEAVTHPAMGEVRGMDSPVPAAEAARPAPESGETAVEGRPSVETEPGTVMDDNETTATIEPPVEEAGAGEESGGEGEAQEEGFIPPLAEPEPPAQPPGVSPPAWESAAVEAPEPGVAFQEPTPDEAGDPFSPAVEGGEGDSEPAPAELSPPEDGGGPFGQGDAPSGDETPTGPSFELTPQRTETPEPESPPVAGGASVDDLVASVVDRASMPAPPRVEPVTPPPEPATQEPPAHEETPSGDGEAVATVEVVTVEPETEAPSGDRPGTDDEGADSGPAGESPAGDGETPEREEVPAARVGRDPIMLGSEEPFALGEAGEASVTAEASAVVAVPVSAGGEVAGDAPPNQLQIQLEGAQALARSGDVRELDILVPVPGAWIGNRRVTLQLRLTLVPAAEEEES